MQEKFVKLEDIKIDEKEEITLETERGYLDVLKCLKLVKEKSEEIENLLRFDKKSPDNIKELEKEWEKLHEEQIEISFELSKSRYSSRFTQFKLGEEKIYTYEQIEEMKKIITQRIIRKIGISEN